MAFVSDSIHKLSDWVMHNQRKKYIYGLMEGSLQDEAFLSRKAATLCELHRLGYSIPPAFILSSHVSLEYSQSESKTLEEPILQDLKAAVDSLGVSCGRVFGASSGPPPLLLSVRGGALVNPNTDVSFEQSSIDSVNTDIVDILGAPDSWCIPGVKESCLGIGMNDRVVEHLASISNPFIAYNTYAHFLVRFGTIVLGAPRRHYRRVLADHVQTTGRAGLNLTREDLMHIVEQFKLIADVPEDPFTQLQMTILEMYKCWFSPTAVAFRSGALNVSRTIGTAVIVQSIVFGGTGVCFTRSPVTGEQEGGVFGTYWAKSGEKIALNEDFQQRDAQAYQRLAETSRSLEQNFKDMQQFEFVYNSDDNVLHILQVQAGRRTPKAAMKIAVDMVAQRSLTEREALLRIDAAKTNFFMQMQLRPDQLESATPLGTGLSASRGVVTAPVVFSSAECMERSMRGEVILCLYECFPIDARALRAASGVITMGGNIFSNAAVLCRGLGKPCITTVRDMSLTLQGSHTVLVSSITNSGGVSGSSGESREEEGTSEGDNLVVIRSGDVITLDGSGGRILPGNMQPTISLAQDGDFQTVLGWADKFRKLRVDAHIHSNTDMVAQVNLARERGGDSIGCISTDGMFSSSTDRLALTRTALLRRPHPDRQQPLQALAQLHRNDLKKVFRAAGTRSIVVKLLDAPLCDYLFQNDEEFLVAFAQEQQLSEDEVRQAVRHTLTDRNPDYGLRGCRISAFYPDITEMQVRAILSAALDLAVGIGEATTTSVAAVEGKEAQTEGEGEGEQQGGAGGGGQGSGEPERVTPFEVIPKILVPMICTAHELESVLALIDRVAYQVHSEYCQQHSMLASIDPATLYEVGAVFNSPRACLRAETVGKQVSFAAFSVDDLTALTFGCQKDDAEKFFPHYIYDKIYLADPFKSLDDLAVGQLVQTGINKCREANNSFDCSILDGDHTSDPRSLDFFSQYGATAVVCSPDHLPVARIAAAQTEIRTSNKFGLVNTYVPDMADYLESMIW
eukprot:gene14255-16387_t